MTNLRSGILAASILCLACGIVLRNWTVGLFGVGGLIAGFLTPGL